MRKFTRRSYNRKLIMFAVSAFMAVGMTSTGFSAWVMSSVQNAEAETPVNVGTVTDASMVVTIDQWVDGGDGYAWTGDTLSFDAIATDETGRVQAGEGSSEVKSMVISGKVTNSQMLGDLTMTISLPESFKAAIAAGYIEFITDANATYSAETGKITVAQAGLNVVDNPDAQEATFTYTLTYAWGDYFGGENPCEFYDNATQVTRPYGEADAEITIAGSAIEGDKMVTEMNAFRALIAGNADNTAYTGTINILVEASTN